MSTERSRFVLADPLATSRPLAGREQVRDVAYRWLRDAIVDGRLHPGQLLSESELAESLEVSRTPLRAAVDRLEFELLLYRRPNRRLVVAELSAQEIDDLYELRIALEPVALRRLGQHLTARTLTELESKATALRLAAPPRSSIQSVDGPTERVDFHEVIVRHSGNRMQYDVYLRFQPIADRYRALGSRTNEARFSESVREHIEIVEALRNGLIDEGAELLQRHLEIGRESARAALSSAQFGTGATDGGEDAS